MFVPASAPAQAMTRREHWSRLRRSVLGCRVARSSLINKFLPKRIHIFHKREITIFRSKYRTSIQYRPPSLIVEAGGKELFARCTKVSSEYGEVTLRADLLWYSIFTTKGRNSLWVGNLRDTNVKQVAFPLWHFRAALLLFVSLKRWTINFHKRVDIYCKLFIHVLNSTLY